MVLSTKGEYGDAELTLACDMQGEAVRANSTTCIHPSTSTAQADCPRGCSQWGGHGEESPAVSTPEVWQKSWWSRVVHQDIHRDVCAHRKHILPCLEG